MQRIQSKQVQASLQHKTAPRIVAIFSAFCFMAGLTESNLLQHKTSLKAVSYDRAMDLSECEYDTNMDMRAKKPNYLLDNIYRIRASSLHTLYCS